MYVSTAEGLCSLDLCGGAGFAPGPQLHPSARVGFYDVEGAGTGHEYGVSYRCCPEVRMGHQFCMKYVLSAARSGSMEPAFYRGDLLFLTNPPAKRYATGDITVYKIPGADIPIVHRVLETHDVVSKECVLILPRRSPLIYMQLRRCESTRTAAADIDKRRQ